MTSKMLSAGDLAFEIDPLLGDIEAYAEILVAAGTSRCADITPNSVLRIGSDILKAARDAMQLITAPLEAREPEDA